MKIMLRVTLTILFAIITNTFSQNEPCTLEMSVELKDRSYNGVRYDEGEYFVDNTTGLERGCVCMKQRCITKCCPFGQAYEYKLKSCVNSTTLFKPPLWRFDLLKEDKQKAYRFDLLRNYHYMFGKRNCDFEAGELRIPVKPILTDIHLRKNGTLYVSYPGNDPPWLIYGPDKYCIDTFVNDFKTNKVSGQGINALICFASEKEPERHLERSSSCILVSCFFILLTVAVYAWLPELRNLHGMVLMAYLLSFFVGFLCMATVQIMLSLRNITADICLVFSFIIFYSILAAIFWLNVMCYDIWWTFSGKRASSGQSSVRRRFLRYCIYAFGMPTLLTALLAGLEFSDMPHSHPLLPNLRIHGCFLNGASKLLYLYGPITMLCIANVTFFVLTALKIYQIKSQTKKVLQSKESTTHDQDRKDKQRFSLYIKLFAVMGLNLLLVSVILEVISSLYPEADYLWQFTDGYNVLIGLIIFITFVCKKKTIRMIQKRYRVLRGLPTISTTQTTMSTSTRAYSTNSRDDVQMETIREPSQQQ